MPKGYSMPHFETRYSQTRHFKSLVSYVLNFKVRLNWFMTKLHTLTVSQMSLTNFWDSNKAFKHASFGNALFGNGNQDNSCLWAVSLQFCKIENWSYLAFHSSLELWVAAKKSASYLTISQSLCIAQGTKWAWKQNFLCSCLFLITFWRFSLC